MKAKILGLLGRALKCGADQISFLPFALQSCTSSIRPPVTLRFKKSNRKRKKIANGSEQMNA